MEPKPQAGKKILMIEHAAPAPTRQRTHSNNLRPSTPKHPTPVIAPAASPHHDTLVAADEHTFLVTLHRICASSG